MAPPYVAIALSLSSAFTGKREPQKGVGAKKDRKRNRGGGGSKIRTLHTK